VSGIAELSLPSNHCQGAAADPLNASIGHAASLSLTLAPILSLTSLYHDKVLSSLNLKNSAKMWILPLVGYLGSVVGFCFMTLAIGAFPGKRALRGRSRSSV
jgi:hypothetical protein